MQNQSGRAYPNTGETWQHYRGQNCYILGILRSGSRQIDFDIVAYELVDPTTKIRSSSRFFKPVEEFMGTVGDINRFDRVDEDISAQIWEQSFQLVT